ncbi:hypothetical protein NRB36_004298 [Salmonella enterica]|nr:hypothetical protein [Salmonella enterica]EJO1639657.1 hypothetical protein [Salmonella enterica]
MSNVTGNKPPNSRPGQFSKENQPAKKRGRSIRSLTAQAMEGMTYKDADGIEKPLTVQAYLCRVITLSMSDPGLMRDVIHRIDPPKKPEFAKAEFELDENANPDEQVKAILAAMRDGQISPDYAAAAANLVRVRVNIMEVSEHERRLSALEEELNLRERADRQQPEPDDEPLEPGESYLE